jgi:hypothetical protein
MGKCSASSLLMAAAGSLRLREDGAAPLQSVPLEQWGEFLALTDEARITLPIAMRYRDAAPEPVRQWLDECISRNAQRHVQIVEAHARLADAMNSHGAEFIVLKGLSHERFWPENSRCRPQYDIDLYCPRESVSAAREAAASLGYEPVRAEEPDADHLPVMIRQTGWRWRGDYYDPQQPLALEIHHRFWNPALGFSVRNAEQFPARRCFERVDGVTLPMLDRVDALDYAAWHAVRHLLRGTLKIFHIYELAQYLHRSADDDGFWTAWQRQGAPEDRITECVAFRLAEVWFGCRLHGTVERAVRKLPANVERWFRLFAFSPIAALEHPNKDELILNLCLSGRADRLRITVRRLFPLLIPARARDDAHVREVSPSVSKPALKKAGFIAQRALHHLRTLGPVVRSGLRWCLSGRASG